MFQMILKFTTVIVPIDAIYLGFSGRSKFLNHFESTIIITHLESSIPDSEI